MIDFFFEINISSPFHFLLFPIKPSASIIFFFSCLISKILVTNISITFLFEFEKKNLLLITLESFKIIVELFGI